MRIDQVVINASLMISLFRAGLQPLLPRLFSDVRVPKAVWDEVVKGGRDDPATRGLPGVDWIEQIKTAADMKVIGWNLGAGETTVLSFALHNPPYSAIVDDRAARRCAHVMNILLLGTAGVIVLAKRRGLIDSVESGLRQLPRRDYGSLKI